MYEMMYMPGGEPQAVRRIADDKIIYLSTPSAELDEFLAWNEAQSTPIDYKSNKPPEIEKIFYIPLRAPQIITEEVILQSPKPKDNPEEALTRAKDILLLKNKPIGEMLFNLLVTVADLSDRLKKLEKKEKKP